MPDSTRRDFLRTAAGVGLATGWGGRANGLGDPRPLKR